MLTVLFAAAMLFAGHALSEWLWCRDARAGRLADPPGALERVTSTGVLGLALWVALCWLLSPLHALARGPLAACAAAAIAGGIVLRRRQGRRTLARPADAVRRWPALLPAVATVPLAAWVAFVLWRGWVLPVLNHDALAYHLPRALLIMRGAGYHGFDLLPDVRFAYPLNYELLLASSLALEGTDVVTEWLGTLVFVLFLCGTGALLERWWGRGRHVLAGSLLVAGVPVLLLHSGAHKNDLLACLFFVTGPLWAARWAVRGGEAPLVLTIISVALAFGTKVHGALVGVGVAPVLLYGAARGHLAWRRVPPLAVLGAAALLLLGGVQYAINLARAGTLTGLPPSLDWYGDWENLWMFPYLALTAPFSGKADHVWVPWRHEYWPWPSWELYVSHFGAPFTPLVLLLPLGVWWSLRRTPRGDPARERALGSLAVVLSAALMLPVRLQGPLGMFSFFPRFLVFVTPVVAGWTLVPVVRALAGGGRGQRAGAVVLVLACSALFTVHAIAAARYDSSQPWQYVLKQATHRGPRSVYYMYNRACSIVDRLAGPEDHIAVHGDTDMCVYLAYGEALRRRVTFIGSQPGPARIPDDAQWVLIDRPLNRMWGHPEFKDFGQLERLQSRGSLTIDDRKVFEQLERDGRFRLVHRNFQGDQAVFRRGAREAVAGGAGPALTPRPAPARAGSPPPAAP